MAEPVPVHIQPVAPREGSAEPTADAAEALGHGAAAMVRYLAGVLDREDRLEAGTGAWLAGFRGDEEARRTTARQSILRAVRLATEPANFAILEALAHGNRSARELATSLGLERLALAERVSDLVSAGLAVKVPEADQVGPTAAGTGLVGFVRRAEDAAAADLKAAQ